MIARPSPPCGTKHFYLKFKSSTLSHSSLASLRTTSPVWCRALLVLYRYSRLSNYLWMVCEALYLHQLVVNAFRRIKYLLRFCLIGWLIPFLLMIPYVIMHANEERNHGCWIEDEDTQFEWVYHLPPIVCLVVSGRSEPSNFSFQLETFHSSGATFSLATF